MTETVERTPAFHFHQSVEKKSYRCWLHFGQHLRRNVQFGAYVLTGSIGVGVQICHGEWQASLRIGVLSLYFSWPGRYRNYGDDREVEISFHDAALWWRFWTDPMSWSSTTPKWRHGCFHFDDFLLGRDKCEHTTIETRDVLIPMPEGAYPAKAELQDWVWRRPRWFANRVRRVHIDVPGGVPVPGKGENAWDCGDDAIFGTTVMANSIAEGVGQLVGSALRSRVRHGGWSDWTWKRSNETDATSVTDNPDGDVK